MAVSILRTNKLCKSFSNGGKLQHVIKNLDLDIYEGDFTVIMGASGSGKSTLLYALSGMDKPSMGQVFFDERDISNYSNDELAVFRRGSGGFVFQSIHLLENQTVLDNVLTSALIVQKHSPKLVQKAKDLLAKVGLDKEDLEKYSSQLSGGEAQRVGIVRAIINDPRIVFADEPTGALNSASSKEVLDIFTDINKKGQSIVMVTHDFKTALRGNRVIFLRDGGIAGDLALGAYEGDSHSTDKTTNRDAIKSRRDKLLGFLEEMGW